MTYVLEISLLLNKLNNINVLIDILVRLSNYLRCKNYKGKFNVLNKGMIISQIKDLCLKVFFHVV